MAKGYIKLYRKFKDSFFYKDSEAVHLWIHILISVNHKDSEIMFNGKRVIIKKGQFITGRKKLSIETGISESKVGRLLKTFKIEQLIEQQATNKFSIISVVNWVEHQESEQLIKQQVNSQRTASEQQVNTNKNDKKEKNDNNDKNNIPLKKHAPSWKKKDAYKKCEKFLEWYGIFQSYGDPNTAYRHYMKQWVESGVDYYQWESMINTRVEQYAVNKNNSELQYWKKINNYFNDKVWDSAESLGVLKDNGKKEVKKQEAFSFGGA